MPMRDSIINFPRRLRSWEEIEKFKIQPWPLAFGLSLWLWVCIWQVAKIAWALIGGLRVI